ncbi:MAG TPA: hypothetical protein VFV08_09490, partial [Puia sp.]|nr:hypothetical protein [Puia sp.]
MKLLFGREIIQASMPVDHLSGIRHLASPWNDPLFFENDVVSILTQELSTRNFSIRWHRWKAFKTTTLHLFSDRPVIVLQCILTGQFSIRESKQDEQIFYESGYDLFYFPSGWSPINVEAGEYSILYIEPDPGFLKDINLIDHSVGELLNALHQEYEQAASLGQVPINFIARNHLNELLNDPLENSDSALITHLSVVGLLKEYLETWKREKTSMIRPNIPHLAKIIKIRDEILHAPHIQKQRLKII